MTTTQTRPKPRFFNSFFMAKNLSDGECSPTSVLNPFGFNQTHSKPAKKSEFECENEPKNGVGLALIQETPIHSICKANAVSRKVLLGSNLNIQIPSYPSYPSHPSSDQLCCDFGIKTPKSQFSGQLTSTESGSVRASVDVLSLSEMELSEEYTRVITYGANPKTTHIYDNCVVDYCCDVLESNPDPDPKLLWRSFLSVCCTCKKSLGDDCDIFMYRGEKAFCSEECRYQEMVLDGLMNSEV